MEKIFDIVNDFVGRMRYYKKTTDSYPAVFEYDVQRAVELKRRGNYESALNIYVNYIDKNKIVYSSLILFIYKVVASAGYLAHGLTLLRIGKDIYDSDPSDISRLFGVPSQFDTHLKKLIEAVSSNRENDLYSYLSSISGSDYYRCPRNRMVMFGELTTNYPQLFSLR